MVSDDEFLHCNLEFYDDARFESIRFEIADFRAGESFTVTAKTLRRVARMDRDQAGDRRKQPTRGERKA